MTPLERLLDELDIRFKPIEGHQQVRCPHPDHDDSIASCSIRLDEQLIKCFGCTLQGGVIDAVMQCKQMTYREAKAWVGEEKPPEKIERRKDNGNDGFRPRYRRTRPAQAKRRRD